MSAGQDLAGVFPRVSPWGWKVFGSEDHTLSFEVATLDSFIRHIAQQRLAESVRISIVFRDIKQYQGTGSNDGIECLARIDFVVVSIVAIRRTPAVGQNL